jgi:hypothetical protein
MTCVGAMHVIDMLLIPEEVGVIGDATMHGAVKPSPALEPPTTLPNNTGPIAPGGAPMADGPAPDDTAEGPPGFSTFGKVGTSGRDIPPMKGGGTSEREVPLTNESGSSEAAGGPSKKPKRNSLSGSAVGGIVAAAVAAAIAVCIAVWVMARRKRMAGQKHSDRGLAKVWCTSTPLSNCPSIQGGRDLYIFGVHQGNKCMRESCHRHDSALREVASIALTVVALMHDCSCTQSICSSQNTMKWIPKRPP